LNVIYNPAAGPRRAHRLWRVLDILSASGMRVQLQETAYAGHATLLARQAIDENPQCLVVAAGGDGTIAEVANGLAGRTARLGVIPLGTANVLARELKLPIAPQAVAAALAFGRTRALWPGIASGRGGDRVFVQMLGVVQTMREMWRYGYAPIRVKIDGVAAEAASVIVTKGTLYAGQYLLAPAARPGEKGFSVALFEGQGPLSALLYGAALPLNLLPLTPGLRLLRASRVEICGAAATPAQADGDPAGEVPISIRDAEHPIGIVVA
jgi:diacylglycerol kinase family enzyme